MSTSTLDHRLSDVRRRVRQVLVTNGVSWLAAVAVGSVLLVCLADWLIHFDDPIVRLIFGLAIVGGGVWVVRRHLITPLQVRLTDTDLALRIEDRYPGFQDSLASSVQFLRSKGDPRIGSPALQQVVVERTLDRLNGLDCDDVVDTREVRRVAAIALGVCLATMLLAGLNQSLTAIALKRLLFPFSAPAWPRKVNLQVLNASLVPIEFDPDHPLHIARGDTFKIFAENTSGRLPSRMALEYRILGQKTVSEAMRPTTINDAEGKHREVAVGQLLAVRGEIEFRAVGGDDDQMPWHRLLAVPPPVVQKLQVTLTPPAYTRRPAERQPEGVGHVQGLVGTRVDISGVSSKPVEKATLRVKDQERHKVQLGEDRQGLSTSFLICDAGIHSWWLELKDPQGFEDAEPPRYEVRGLQDFEPEIYIEQPASDMQVTAEAVVPLRTIARDDLGLKQLRLVYKVETSEGTDEQTISLFLAGRTLPLTQTAEYQWKIADLKSQPGGRIVFHTEATDEFDLSTEFPGGNAPPLHIGRSVTRTLTIVSSAEKSREIAQRQEGLLNDLERAFKLEQQAHGQVGDLLVQIENAENFRPEDLDTLQRTEMGQREVASQLGNPTTGLEKRARDLAEELQNNQINDPQTERRLKRIGDELSRIGHEYLQPIEQELTRARKLVQSRDKTEKSRSQKTDGAKKKSALPPGGMPPASESPTGAQPEKRAPSKPETLSQKSPDSSPTGASQKAARKANDTSPAGDRPEDALRQVSENQDAVLESLGEMLQELSQWRGENDAARELGDLVRQQSELNQRAAELGKKTLTKAADALSGQEQADLAKIAERQKKQADQLEQLEAKMRGTVENLAGENPSAAATLQEAVEQSQQEAIAGEMRDAAGQIGENQMGQAARSQQEILKKLHDLEDTLRQKRESDTEMMVKKLKQAGAELSNLRDRQAEVKRKTAEVQQNGNPQEREEQLAELRKEQQKLHEETARLARRLARLEAQTAQTSAARAAGRMQQAADRLDESGPSGAGDAQQEALDDLEQAQRAVARQQRAQEEQLAREQLAKVADELSGMLPRQQSVIDNTRRLDDLHAESGKWSRAQLVSLRDLSKVQQRLEEDTARLIEKVATSEVFALALKGAARHMHSAGEQLAQRQTGTPTQKIQEAARKRLADLVDALKPDEPYANNDEPPPENDQEGGAGGGQEMPPGDGIPTLAQVKMLITLQRELFARTAEIELLRGKDGQLPAAARAELKSIAREQGDLADLTRNLSGISSPAEEDGENRNSNDKPQSE